MSVFCCQNSIPPTGSSIAEHGMRPNPAIGCGLVADVSGGHCPKYQDCGSMTQKIRRCTSHHPVQFPLELAEILRSCCDPDQFVQQSAVSFPEAVYALGHPSRN